jgi:hypothetical protein
MRTLSNTITNNPSLPLLNIALAQTWFLVDRCPEHSILLLSDLSEDLVLETFLTPHWEYRAASSLFNNRQTVDSASSLQAFGDASAVLTGYHDGGLPLLNCLMR